MFNCLRINETVAGIAAGYRPESSIIAEAETKLGKPVDEHKWAKAKSLAEKELGKKTGDQFYAYTMGIYKKMMGEGVQDEKDSRVQVPYKKGHYQVTFTPKKGEKRIRRIYQGDDMKATFAKAKEEIKKDHPESHGYAIHSPQTDESIEVNEPSIIAEDEKTQAEADDRNKLYHKMLGLDYSNPQDTYHKYKKIHHSKKKTAKAAVNALSHDEVKKRLNEADEKRSYTCEDPDGKRCVVWASSTGEAKKKASAQLGCGMARVTVVDQTNSVKEADEDKHDEAKEEKEDPTREKMETAKDEDDEKKGGPAELAADLRVSIRIEKMGIGRYKRMLSKHELSSSDEKWLKRRIEDLEACIKDMEAKLPELEKEAKGEAVKEAVAAEIKAVIVEVATGKYRP